jgi:hypothetical protein
VLPETLGDWLWLAAVVATTIGVYVLAMVLA